MTSDTSPLFIIPVRGGSKGIPRKNLRTVGGISLLGRAVRAARAATRLLGRGRVVVDSDDEELLSEGRHWGAETPFVRPAHLATDEASYLDGLRHALSALSLMDSPVPVAVVQATSPLTPPSHLAEAILRHEATGRPVVSVAQSAHPVEWAMRVESGRLLPAGGTFHRRRRQDLSPSYQPTGAVYVAAANALCRGGDFFVAGETEALELASEFALDIDRPAELRVADAVARGLPATTTKMGHRHIGRDHSCLVVADLRGEQDVALDTLLSALDALVQARVEAVLFPTLAHRVLEAAVTHARSLGLLPIANVQTHPQLPAGSLAAAVIATPNMPEDDLLSLLATVTDTTVVMDVGASSMPQVDAWLQRAHHPGMALVGSLPARGERGTFSVARKISDWSAAFRLPMGILDASSHSTALMAARFHDAALWLCPVHLGDACNRPAKPPTLSVEALGLRTAELREAERHLMQEEVESP